MPLNAEREPGSAGHCECLDQAIISHGGNLQFGAQSIDTLRMQRIDGRAAPAGQFLQQAALCEINIVGRAILDVQRLFRIFLVNPVPR